jgi:hypothetical protein
MIILDSATLLVGQERLQGGGQQLDLLTKVDDAGVPVTEGAARRSKATPRVRKRRVVARSRCGCELEQPGTTVGGIGSALDQPRSISALSHGPGWTGPPRRARQHRAEWAGPRSRAG